jgi:hypothetical protein
MKANRRVMGARGGGALMLAIAPLPWLGMGSASATPGSEDNITICHRTNAVGNPYVQITVDPSAVDGIAGNSGKKPDHYGEHTGPVFDPNVDYQPPMSGDEWGDIIPPIPGVHEGLNWTTQGQALYYFDCKLDVPTPTESESSVTPTETESSVTPTETESSVTPTEIESSSSQPEVIPTETSTSPVSVLPTRSERPGALPQTGSSFPVGSALAASLLLIVLGGLLLVGPGRLAVDRYQRRH